jgi:16S rRNA (uracil1498-N3)-methyltransferase
LPDDLAHYALRVLRLRDGAEVVLFDGTGGEYAARIERVGKRLIAHLGTYLPREAELTGRITLVQGLPSGDKMDWVIEKAVELGVQRIVSIAAERSVLQLQNKRLGKRLAHWWRVAQSAAEQCGRNRVPEIVPPQRLAEWLGSSHDAVTLMCHPQASHDLRAALTPPPTTAAITLVVGPEGGWSPAEQEAAAQVVTLVRWGPRVLRSETAGVALTAAAIMALGWENAT